MNELAQLGFKLLTSTWTVAAQMAPYLLLGFLMAGLLSVFISPAFVEAHLGRRSLWQVVKAALLGVPLPLCSCGVLPVGASLRRHGAGKGATLSFLAATPQTGLDSVMATQALLGPVFVIFRIATAFVSGILGGFLVEATDRGQPAAEETQTAASCGCCKAHPRGRLYRMLHYGLVDLAREIGRAVFVGILISGVLTALVPKDYLAGLLGPGILSMLVMMVVGIPLYACSAGSVPIAFALIQMGVSPGAALVFLVTAPATNAASITTVWSVLGRRSALIYLFAIGASALAAGFLMDQLAVRTVVGTLTHGEHAAVGWFQHLSAVVLIGVLLPCLMPRRKPDEP